jgi:peptidyl-dipeptidase A
MIVATTLGFGGILSMKKLLVMALLLAVLLTFGRSSQAFSEGNEDVKTAAQKFLADYNEKWNELRYQTSLAEWESNTRIIEGDDTNAKRTAAAAEKLSAFTGSKENIEAATKFLKEKSQLTPLQILQLERVLYAAAESPAVVSDLVKERIAAETKQVEKLYGFDFKIEGKSATPNQIDDTLRNSANLKERRKAWEASKEVGKGLKDGLANLQRLRNSTVKALGYPSFFSYQVSEYGMSAEEMVKLVKEINQQLRPLYRELHTYARYELAQKYGAPVPDELPADWLPNRWAQEWQSMIKVSGLNITDALKDKSAEWIVRQGEQFYISLGWPALPQSFWEKSSLYPLPADAKYKKNTHASAWHLDNKNDLRSLMSVEPNAEWYETVHHELGHIYYYVSYSNPNVPLVLRIGANRAYHEAMGSLMGLASQQKPFLIGRGLISKDAKVDETQALLSEALNYIPFIPFSTGTMTEFEYELYEKNLPKEQYNKRWWELAYKYQGIVPPTNRGEEFCDACTKTHINDDPAQYYDYALSYVLLFQLHDHIARNILKQDPHATNYYGNKAVGDFLRELMTPGGTRNWRELLKEKTGEDLNAKAMLRYFEPLMDHLKKVNSGRKYTLPEKL